eukprot:11165-Heterococcus_DN1.PRE.1
MITTTKHNKGKQQQWWQHQQWWSRSSTGGLQRASAATGRVVQVSGLQQQQQYQQQQYRCGSTARASSVKWDNSRRSGWAIAADVCCEQLRTAYNHQTQPAQAQCPLLDIACHNGIVSPQQVPQMCLTREQYATITTLQLRSDQLLSVRPRTASKAQNLPHSDLCQYKLRHCALCVVNTLHADCIVLHDVTKPGLQHYNKHASV